MYKKKHKPTGNPMGRPKIPIDDEKLCQILQLKPKLEWIASFFSVDEETIRNHCKTNHGMTFSQLRNKMMFNVRLGLIRQTVDQAMKGNTGLMIFALKNMCGWADMPSEFEEDGEHELVFD